MYNTKTNVINNIKLSRALTAYQTAERLFKLKHYQQALNCYNIAIEIQPDLIEAYCGRGATHTALSNFSQALADASYAISLQPDCSIAYYLRGAVSYAVGNWEMAKNSLLTAANLFKNQGQQNEYERVIGLLNQASTQLSS